MIPVVIGFGIFAVVAGSATVLLPLVKAGITQARRRRRSRNRKKRRHIPRERIDLTAPLPGKRDRAAEPESTADTG